MRRVRPHLILAVAALAALAVLLAGCGRSTTGAAGGSSPASTAAPVKGGTLVATYQGEPQGLDPAIDWEGQGWAIEHCLFNNFIKYASKPGTAGTEMLPDLATELPTTENGGISKDGTVYTFHLKKGIKFAPPVDREVTSADFKYSFERMMADPKAPATGFYTGVVGAQAFMDGKAKEITGYQTPDKYTVVIHLSHPDMAFMGAMAMSFTDVVAEGVGPEVGPADQPPPAGHRPLPVRPLDARARRSSSSAIPTTTRRTPSISTASTSSSRSTRPRRCSSWSAATSTCWATTSRRRSTCA